MGSIGEWNQTNPKTNKLTDKSQNTLAYLEAKVKTQCLIVIIKLMGSVMVWLKVILLSSVHCILPPHDVL